VPEPVYIAVALATAIAITVTLRAVPFVMKSRLKESQLLADVGRWMPLGAVVILAIYALAGIKVSGPGHGAPELAGVVVTVAVHWWRGNTVLSIVAGTAVCLLLANGVIPA
jgi:branched-subunit amino acid transport protein AzlD